MVLGVGYVSGVWAADSAKGWLWIAIGWGVLAGALAVFRWKRIVGLWVCVAGMGIWGYLGAASALAPYGAPDRVGEYRTTIRVRVAEVPRVGEARRRFAADVLPARTRVRVVLSCQEGGAVPEYGQIGELTGRYQPVAAATNPGQFAYDDYLRHKGVWGLFRADDWLAEGMSVRNPMVMAAWRVHQRMLAVVRRTVSYPYSELLMSLVVGDWMAELPQDWSDRFRRTGLTHLLVVSGSQVSLVSGIVLRILGLCRLRKWVQYLLLTLCNVFFYLITGGGASIFRSVAMTQVASALGMAQRSYQPLHVMAISGMLMLWINPLYAFDVGFWLSFAATFSLMYGVPRVVSVFPARWPEWVRELLATAVAPFLMTLPLTWWCFATLSPVSLLSNLAVVNGIELLVILGAVAGVLGMVWVPLAAVINSGTEWVLRALMWVVAQFDRLTYGVVSASPPSIWMVVACYVGVIVALEYGSRYPRRFWIGAGVGCVFGLAVWGIPALFPERMMTVTFLDVGQGDAAVVESPTGRVMLIDAGNRRVDFVSGKVNDDKGRLVVAPFLRVRGISKLDVVMASHFHMDHIGGMPYVMGQFPVGVALDNGGWEREYAAMVGTKRIARRTVQAGDGFSLDRFVSVKVLYPELAQRDSGNENNNSVVVKVSMGEMDFLFAGDLEAEGEADVVARSAERLAAEVLKVGHHGSRTSSGEEFLAAVRPQVAVVSVGAKNKFRHPSPQVVQRLGEHGIQVYRTDQHGAVMFRTDGKRLFVRVFR